MWSDRDSCGERNFITEIGLQSPPSHLHCKSHGAGSSEVVGTSTTWMPSFIHIGLKDSLPLFRLGKDSRKEPPTVLSLCETRRVLIRKGTHYCGSPQQRLIASRVGPQTWHLCPLAYLNWQTACWLAFALHPDVFPLEMEGDFDPLWLALCILRFIVSLCL